MSTDTISCVTAKVFQFLSSNSTSEALLLIQTACQSSSRHTEPKHTHCQSRSQSRDLKSMQSSQFQYGKPNRTIFGPEASTEPDSPKAETSA